MKRVTRNKILIWLLVLGLVNFSVYAVFYWYFQGDACNGFIRDGEYFLRGHFIHTPDGRASEAVSRPVWIYSFLHSISIWPTIGTVLISMLILARPHIIATMKTESLIRGKVFVNASLAIIVLVTTGVTAVFVVNLVQALQAAAAGRSYGL